MRDRHTEIEAAGAGVAVVGSGLPFMAKAFHSEQSLPFPVYVDPELATYKAAGMKRSLASTFSPKAVFHGLRAFKAGHRQGKTQGDPFQQGGVLVVDTAGELRYVYASKQAGDHPDLDDVVAALKGLAA